MTPSLFTERKTIGEFTVFERTPKPKGVSRYFVMKGGSFQKDASKFSTAIRWVKAQVRTVPHVVVIMEDKTAFANLPMTVTFIDGPHRLEIPAKVDPFKMAELLALAQERDKQWHVSEEHT